MSDLAPFVAALLRDDVVDDLKAENDNLRSENAKTRAFVLESTKTGGCLQITGQGGSPVYAHASLNNARFQFIDTDVHHNTVNCFKLGLTPNSDYMCQLSKVCHAELRVNGIKVATLGEGDSGNYGWNSEYYEADVSGMKCQKQEYVFHHGFPGMHWGRVQVSIHFGPIPSNHTDVVDMCEYNHTTQTTVAPFKRMEEMKDEDVTRVCFKSVGIELKEDGNETDILVVASQLYEWVGEDDESFSSLQGR